MTETIYGVFPTENQAYAAETELTNRGFSEVNIVLDYEALRLTVIAKIANAIEVRNIIEKHRGRTEVDNIPDVGTIPNDPMDYSDDIGAGVISAAE